jgi:hypothetical protein
MNPATNATAIAMIITQTQIEALASFFSSISITSFVAIQLPIERSGKPDFHVSVKNKHLHVPLLCKASISYLP